MSDWLLGARNVETMPRVTEPVANIAFHRFRHQNPLLPVYRSNSFEEFRIVREICRPSVSLRVHSKSQSLGKKERIERRQRLRFKRIRGGRGRGKLAAISAPIYRRGIVESCGDGIRGWLRKRASCRRHGNAEPLATANI